MTNKNVPKLRFPEFTEKWQPVKIKDIFSERTEKNCGELDLLSVTLNNGVIPRSEIDGKDNSSNNKNNYKLVKPQDIVYNSMRMWQGANGVSNLEGIVSPAYTVLIPRKDVCSDFYGYYFKIDRMLNEFKKYSQGLTSDTWNLKYHLISQIIIKKTSYKEQEKIVSFLRTIDQKINLLINQKDEMIEFKHYLLQNLFPQNGERVPKLRFIEEIYYKRQNVSDFLIESEIDAIDNINKRLTVKLNLKGVYKREIKPNEKEGATKQYKRKAGQFIYGKQNLFKGAFGIIPSELDGFLSSKDLPSFDFKDNINSKWFYYYFSRSNFYKHLENLSNGTGSKRISPEEFLKIQINVPQSIEEQEKIASFLSFVDKKIDLLDQEIELVEEYKKGLLQKMFI